MEEQNESILEKLEYRDTNHNYKQIYKLKEKKELAKYYNIGTDLEDECFYIQYLDRTCFDYFFYHPIIIQYSFENNEKDKGKIEFNNIYSAEQIEKCNIDKNVKNPYIVLEDTIIDYNEAKYKIYKYIKNNRLTITDEKNDNEDNYIFDENVIKDDNFEKEKLSKYFDNYFIYNKKEEKDFEYDNTNNRRSLIFEYINEFTLKKKLRFFKFCGPSSTGKSTTLLKYSREQRGIVYLNLKAIHELDKKNRFKECYDLITYELRRLYFTNEEKKESFIKVLKDKCKNKNPWEIILNVIIDIKDTNNIIIFDQFKKSYLCNDYYSKIEDNIKTSELKLIICSSINNKEIRDEVIKTIEYYKGNPKNFDDNSQNYYYYFSMNFFNKKAEKDNKLNPLFELFDYKPKYKYLLLKSNNINECITEIKSKINKKIKEFFSYDPDLDICKILLNIKNNINMKLFYDNDSDMNILKKLPLKYFIIKVYSNYFEIDYAFKFIKYIEKEIISKEDCENYFKLKKYKTDKSLDGKVKGEYFEMSARFYIKLNDVLPVKIDDIINVNNIVGLDPLLEEETLDNIINSINITFKNDSFDPKKKEEDNIIFVNNLLNKENIATQENLEIKYCSKNLKYYLRNELLNYKEKEEEKKKKNEEQKEKDNIKIGKNKRKKTDICEKEDKDEKSEENEDNESNEGKQEKKKKNQKR